MKTAAPPPPPPEKGHPLFPINPTLKIEILSSPPPFLKIREEAQLPHPHPPNRKKGGGGAVQPYVLPSSSTIHTFHF